MVACSTCTQSDPVQIAAGPDFFRSAIWISLAVRAMTSGRTVLQGYVGRCLDMLFMWKFGHSRNADAMHSTIDYMNAMHSTIDFIRLYESFNVTPLIHGA